jgi:hypothetical protein
MRLFKILWSYKVLLPPNFALTGLHTLYTSLDCILDLQLKIKNFKVDKYSLKNFHQMTQASPRLLLLPPSCELGGMITKAYAALEGRVITGTINLTKVAV